MIERVTTHSAAKNLSLERAQSRVAKPKSAAPSPELLALRSGWDPHPVAKSPTPEIPPKFGPDGSALYFPGNTTVSMLAPRQREPFQALQAELQAAFGAGLVTLPPSSFHMTTMDLVADPVRKPSHWSNRLPLDAPLSETDARFARWLEPVRIPNELRMVVDRLNAERRAGQGIQVYLKPADEVTALRLKTYRDDVAQATGVRFPNHDAYQFHVTLAYLLRDWSPADVKRFNQIASAKQADFKASVGVLKLPAPGLVYFNDMFSFSPVRPDRAALEGAAKERSFWRNLEPHVGRGGGNRANAGANDEEFRIRNFARALRVRDESPKRRRVQGA